MSGVVQSRGEIEARCDSTAGDGWIQVGPREAKKPGRKGNADPEGWGHRLTSLTRLKKLANAGLLAAELLLFFS